MRERDVTRGGGGDAIERHHRQNMLNAMKASWFDNLENSIIGCSFCNAGVETLLEGEMQETNESTISIRYLCTVNPFNAE